MEKDKYKDMLMIDNESTINKNSLLNKDTMRFNIVIKKATVIDFENYYKMNRDGFETKDYLVDFIISEFIKENKK